MARYPARDAHTDRTYLFGTNPCARAPCHPAGLDTEVAAGPEHDIFQIAHVLVHVTAIGMEIEDRIANELTGTMIGDVAAPPGLMKFDVPRREQLRRRDQMRTCGVRFDAERDDMRMFEQKEEVGDTAGATFLDERSLHVARDRIRNHAQPPDFQLAHMYMVACR